MSRPLPRQVATPLPRGYDRQIFGSLSGSSCEVRLGTADRHDQRRDGSANHNAHCVVAAYSCVAAVRMTSLGGDRNIAEHRSYDVWCQDMENSRWAFDAAIARRPPPMSPTHWPRLPSSIRLSNRFDDSADRRSGLARDGDALTGFIVRPTVRIDSTSVGISHPAVGRAAGQPSTAPRRCPAVGWLRDRRSARLSGD
jgi:hypothetical protein